jgi:WD40 repeat protein
VRFLEGHDGPIFSLACLLQKNYLASGSRDRSIKIWNYKSGLLVKTLRGHLHLIGSMQLLANGLLASASYDKTVLLWNMPAFFASSFNKTIYGERFGDLFLKIKPFLSYKIKIFKYIIKTKKFQVKWLGRLHFCTK